MHRTEGANNVAGLYTAGPPPTTITADAMNSLQEEISNVIEYSGLELQTASTDTRDQLLAAVLRLVPTYDAIVTGQASFDAIVERSAANTYRFKSQYKSVFLKNGTYLMTLSGGDTWGQLQTNAVTYIDGEAGSIINFGNTPGYLHINTIGCTVKNIAVSGLATVASAVQYCFYVSTYLVSIMNCIALTRLSNTDVYGFYDNSGSIFNKYTNCYVGSLTSSGAVTGYYNCYNLQNCTANGLAATAAGAVYGFSTCLNLSNCIANTLDSVNGNCSGFYGCNQISSSKAVDIDVSGTADCFGFNGCKRITGCYVYDIASASDTSAFSSCDDISSCTAENISSSGLVAGVGALGFVGCKQISGCTAKNISCMVASKDAVGFYSSNQVSGCFANDINSGGTATGFNQCAQIAACYVSAISGASYTFGYTACAHGAALHVYASLIGSNATCSYMDASSGGITVDWSIQDIFV